MYLCNRKKLLVVLQEWSFREIDWLDVWRILGSVEELFQQSFEFPDLQMMHGNLAHQLGLLELGL